MDNQQVLNLVVSLVCGIMGWLLNELWSAHKALAQEHHAHTLTVAKDYVSKEDLNKQLDEIRKTLDNIWKAVRKGE